jgi:hypothetical protein
MLKGNVTVTGDHPQAAFGIDGLLVEGRSEIEGNLGSFKVLHCTLVPGRSLEENGKPIDSSNISINVAAPNEMLQVDIDSSITGRLRLPDEMKSLVIRDSILDAFGGMALSDPDGLWASPTTLQRSTVFGEIRVKELTLASEVIFMGNVDAKRQQVGCVRFSYVPEKSQTPRRYRCQPDLALEKVADTDKARVKALLVPSFTSKDYGHPGYAQLGPSCAKEIRTGAEKGSEMGAFCKLMQPQRETNLLIRLEEYLPFGLEAGIIYVT